MFRSKKNKLLIRWIMSYVLVILISISISGGILLYSLRAQKQELEQNNRTMFEMIQNRTDTMFEMVQNIALSFENDPAVLSYIESPEPSVSATYEIIHSIAGASVNTLSYNMIGGIYLYVANGDYVLNDLGKYPSMEFYKTYHQSENLPYQTWLELMGSKHSRKYQTMRYRMSGVSDAPGICMLQTLESGDKSATLVVVLNAEMIEELLASTWSNAKIGLGIYDSSGQRIFYYGDDKVKNLLSEPEETVNADGKYETCVVKSTITMFQYKFLYPISMFSELYIKIYVIFGAMLLVLALLAVGATSHYAKKNYASLQRIAQLIEKNVKTKIKMDDQVYAYMEQELHSTFEKHRDMAETLEKQDRQMKQIFVANLMTHSRVGNEVITEHLKKFHIHLLSDAFYVAIFYVVDIEDIFFEKNQGEYDDQLRLANFIIENITTEMLSEKFLVLSNEVDDTYAAIINLPFEAGMKEEMIRIFQESIQIISKEFGFSFKICVSNLEHGLTNTHNAYKNAAYTLDYSLTVSSDEILFYDDITEAVSYASTDLMSVQEKYTGLMQSGNYVDAINVLDPLFQELEIGSMSLDMLKCKMYALINLIVENIRMAAKLNHDISQDFAEKQIFLLEKIKTLPDLREAHTKILTAMHEMTNLQGADKNVHLIEQAQKYICENYTDCNMSVGALADHFHLNALYFSRLFTKYTGKYVSDYITQVRIDKVKELLIYTDDTIAVIAGKTGFYSDVVLIRSFKKNIGTTPGKYRQQNKQLGKGEKT